MKQVEAKQVAGRQAETEKGGLEHGVEILSV